MHSNRTAGGWALIATALASVVVFFIHPFSPDHGPILGPWGMNSITHTLGVGLLPILLMGCWALAEWLGLDRPLVRLALCANLLMVVLTAVAGLTSGWITPAGYELGHDFGKLAVAINRACDRGYVAFMALAMLGNGLSLPRRWRGLRNYSLVIGIAPLAWVLSGAFDPHVHAMLLLSLGQMVWWIALGRAMVQGDAEAGPA